MPMSKYQNVLSLKQFITNNLLLEGYCTNYPEHSTEGFKNFNTLENCQVASENDLVSITMFSNGCTLRYICENGFQPFQQSISCLEGFWNGRALCVKPVKKSKHDKYKN
jgi:hypothetical protein